MKIGERAHYQVHEIFASIQGEGSFAGRTATFVRLQGCPVGCPWCDAKLTWYAGGQRMGLSEILALMTSLPPTELVIITGGEPCLYNLDPLIAALRSLEPWRSVHLETSGAYPLLGLMVPSHTVVSPKAAADWRIDETLMLIANELKYVVDENFSPAVVRDHLARIKQVRSKTGRYHREMPAMPIVSLMPEGSPPRDEMVETTLAILDAYPLWRFSPRLQYAYDAIRHREGDTNQSLTVESAREASRAHARAHRD